MEPVLTAQPYTILPIILQTDGALFTLYPNVDHAFHLGFLQGFQTLSNPYRPSILQLYPPLFGQPAPNSDSDVHCILNEDDSLQYYHQYTDDVLEGGASSEGAYLSDEQVEASVHATNLSCFQKHPQVEFLVGEGQLQIEELSDESQVGGGVIVDNAGFGDAEVDV